MPRRNDIKKILIVGSGPIVIGQACEFDYSGTQACKALRKLGYEVVLVNSNPATIMTDPEMADITYIEPLNVERLTEIIETERPDSFLPNLGGQSALNLCSELYKSGVLDKYGVKVIGVQADAIDRGEDRIAFKEAMDKLGIEMAASAPAYSVEEAVTIAEKLGFPLVVRPAYTMGGTGGGLVYNMDELKTIVSRGIAASMVGQVLIEESVLGWEELELEVVRDANGKMVTVCFIENVDPMGVHTGDSFCVAPMLTISQELQERLQKYAYAIVESIGVIGGTNVQFAHDPKTDRVIIIEINPRTSRSSALASKATGFPIAYVSALLAAGLTLDEIPYWKEGTLDKYAPSGDYVVVKFARWAFEKFKGAEDKLGTQMKAIGEVMSIGKNFKEAMQKAIRSLENSRAGLGSAKKLHDCTLGQLIDMLRQPSSERYFIIYEALRKGATVDQIHNLTKVKKYFLEQIAELVEQEEAILRQKGNPLSDDQLKEAKLAGFSDKYLAELLDVPEIAIREQREAAGIVQHYDEVPVSGVENEAYFYSTYQTITEPAERKVAKDAPKVMILGGGPNRIGQGIEFDYCCVHAALTLRELGYQTIIVNCNPETVSTDYDTSDRLYFEPLTTEDVLSIYKREGAIGMVVQFGGQTPLNIASELAAAGVHILGTQPSVIDMAEDRDMFREMMDKLYIPMPESGIASDLAEARHIANHIGYPVMCRPSYVLGGRGMEVIQSREQMDRYISEVMGINPDKPILVDRFLTNAIEAEADAICDGQNAVVPAIMEHIELAGIHSGDSTCVIPPISISLEQQDTIRQYTERIAKAMGVVGLINVQFAIADGKVYVIEANPRASRTVPLVSKVCNISMAKIATEVMVKAEKGERMDLSVYRPENIPYFGVKEAVFPFNMFPEVDPVLGPEMRSTGEVLGLAESFDKAFYKSQEAVQCKLPADGKVFISVADTDKEKIVTTAQKLHEMGFPIIATKGTQEYLSARGIPCQTIEKRSEGRPNILDEIVNETVCLVINTPYSADSIRDDAYIRKAVVKYHIPYFTTTAAAYACAVGIEAFRKSQGKTVAPVKSLQSYHKMLP